MNPLLQRLLISLAAGAATSGVVVSTSKRPHRLQRRKKKKKGDKDKPVALGAVALADAKLPEDRGLTAGEWRDAVVARGKSVASIFKKKPKEAPTSDSNALEPDEVDGKRVAKKSSSGKKGKKKKRRREQDPASLWDSAKQSFKDTVKETVREEVKQTSVGGAFEKLKTMSAKVKEGAAAAMDSAQKAAKNAKLDEKLANAKTAISAAVATVAEKTQQTSQQQRAALDGTAPDSSTASDDGTGPDKRSSSGERAGIVSPKPGEPAVGEAVEGEAVEGEPVVAEAGVGEAGVGDPVVAEPVVAEVVAPSPEVGKRVADAVGSWLKAEKPKVAHRVRPAGTGGDVVEAVVEARDPPPAPPPSSTATPPAPATSDGPSTPESGPDHGEILDDGSDKAA